MLPPEQSLNYFNATPGFFNALRSSSQRIWQIMHFIPGIQVAAS